MPYHILEEEATADVAFEATGRNLAEVFKAASEAVVDVMVRNPESIVSRESREITMEDSQLDLLLFNFLEQFIYFKDAQQFLARSKSTSVMEKQDGSWLLSATLEGERLDPERHEQMVDVKAITMHEFTLERRGEGWRAHVVLDI